jgi:hypothetical protein
MKPNYCYCCEEEATTKLISETDISFFYCCGAEPCKKEIRKSLKKLNKKYVKSEKSEDHSWKQNEPRYNYKIWREKEDYLPAITVLALCFLSIIGIIVYIKSTQS